MEPDGPSTRGESLSARLIAREPPLVKVYIPVLRDATHATDHRAKVALVGYSGSQAVLNKPESEYLMSTCIASGRPVAARVPDSSIKRREKGQ